jgi:hypothetical protein
MNHSEQLNDLAKALAAEKGELPTVAKDSNNPFFKSKYAGLPEVMKTASPVLAKHGLAVSQFVTHANNAPWSARSNLRMGYRSSNTSRCRWLARH